ncbi:sensor domain-containing protein [Micromonospora sp. URMC 103]|uniref:sensor domain-containing protein n=1 Tax=Micromonospora sp. URMC 103 TaxID=3423406 RepID=UPI003F1B50F5
MGTTAATGVGGSAKKRSVADPLRAGGDVEPVSVARQAILDLRHLVGGLPLALAGTLLAVATLTAAALCVVGIGLPLLDRAVTRTRAVLDRQRARVGGEPVPSPYRPAAGPFTARLPVLLADPASYRDLAFPLVHLPLGLVAAALPAALWLGAALGLALPVLHEVRPGLVDARFALPVGSPHAWLAGVLAAVGAYWLPRGLIDLEARLTRTLLGPTAGAARTERLPEPTGIRARTVGTPAGGPTVVAVELPTSTRSARSATRTGATTTTAAAVRC